MLQLEDPAAKATENSKSRILDWSGVSRGIDHNRHDREMEIMLRLNARTFVYEHASPSIERTNEVLFHSERRRSCENIILQIKEIRIGSADGPRRPTFSDVVPAGTHAASLQGHVLWT